MLFEGIEALGTQFPGVHRPAGVGIGRIQRVCLMQTRFRLPQQPPGKAAVAPLLWDDTNQETVALALRFPQRAKKSPPPDGVSRLYGVFLGDWVHRSYYLTDIFRMDIHQ